MMLIVVIGAYLQILNEALSIDYSYYLVVCFYLIMCCNKCFDDCHRMEQSFFCHMMVVVIYFRNDLNFIHLMMGK